MPEAEQLTVLLNPKQSQPCPACGHPADLTSKWKKHVLVPEAKIHLASHRVTKRLNGYFVTATVICDNCSNAFEIYANAARFKGDQMNCRICRRSKYMKSDVRDVQYDYDQDVYLVAAIVYCRHCWMLAWVLGLVIRIFRPAVAEVELAPAPREADNTAKGVLLQKLRFLQEKQAINAGPSLAFEITKEIENVEKQLESL